MNILSFEIVMYLIMISSFIIVLLFQSLSHRSMRTEMRNWKAELTQSVESVRIGIAQLTHLLSETYLPPSPAGLSRELIEAESEYIRSIYMDALKQLENLGKDAGSSDKTKSQNLLARHLCFLDQLPINTEKPLTDLLSNITSWIQSDKKLKLTQPSLPSENDLSCPDFQDFVSNISKYLPTVDLHLSGDLRTLYARFLHGHFLARMEKIKISLGVGTDAREKEYKEDRVIAEFLIATVLNRFDDLLKESEDEGLIEKIKTYENAVTRPFLQSARIEEIALSLGRTECDVRDHDVICSIRSSFPRGSVAKVARRGYQARTRDGYEIIQRPMVYRSE